MQFHWTKREKKLALIFFFALFLVVSLYFYDKANQQTTANSSINSIPSKREVHSIPSGEKDSEEKSSTTIAVDIKGAVVNPGVYILSKGARLNEVIRLAGGFLGDADDRMINQAKLVVDGDMVYIPKKGEVQQPQMGSIAMSNNAGASTVDKLISINNATVSQLGELPGIGEAKAKAILAYRTSHGPFKSKEEIKKVSGIGEKLYERIKDNISLD